MVTEFPGNSSAMKILSWNMGKRQRASARLPLILDELSIDVGLLQESSTVESPPSGFATIVTPDLLPDTMILIRDHLMPEAVRPSPLPWFGSYAALARAEMTDIQIDLVSVHALARPARPRELDGLDPDDIRRPDEAEPWLNDLAIAQLIPYLKGRRFLVGADLNTSRHFQAGSLLERAKHAGWVELIEHHHGQQVPTFHTRRSRKHQLDYLFADRETAASCLDVAVLTELTDGRGDGTSDHAPIVAVLDL